MGTYILKISRSVILLATSMLFAQCSSSEENVMQVDKSTIAESSGYADRMLIPVKELTCYTGGPEHKECKIEPGIKIGDFLSIGCGVTCMDGAYACCGVRCACVPED